MRALRIALRITTLLLLGAAAVSLAALSGEYPGATSAGRHVAMREVLPLTLLAWVHVEVLDAPEYRNFRRWAAVALVGDMTLVVSGAARARRGGAPLTVALPVVAALLLAVTVGLAWRVGRARVAPNTRADER